MLFTAVIGEMYGMNEKILAILIAETVLYGCVAAVKSFFAKPPRF